MVVGLTRLAFVIGNPPQHSSLAAVGPRGRGAAGVYLGPGSRSLARPRCSSDQQLREQRGPRPRHP